MATYLMLLTWTDQGIKNVKDMAHPTYVVLPPYLTRNFRFDEVC